MYRQRQKGLDKKENSTIVIIVFQSGKCIITGGKSREQILRTWNDFYYRVLVHHVAVIDYGSSGNYRISQHKKSCSELDTWLLQQIAHSAMPQDASVLDNQPDMMQIELSQNSEIRAIESITSFVKRPMQISTGNAEGEVYRGYCPARRTTTKTPTIGMVPSADLR